MPAPTTAIRRKTIQRGLAAEGGAQGRRVDAQRREDVHRERQRRQALLRQRAHESDVPSARARPCFWCPRTRRASASARCFNKSGWRFYQNAELIFEDARVPHANVVGEVQRRHESAQRRGGRVRRSRAGGECARACAMLHSSRRGHARRRRRAAVSASADHQLVQLKLNQMHMQTEALRSYVLRSACRDGPGRARLAERGSRHEFFAATSSSWSRGSISTFMASRAATVDALADKLVRDGIIWTHLAGDATQRLKVMRRLVVKA